MTCYNLIVTAPPAATRAAVLLPIHPHIVSSKADEKIHYGFEYTAAMATRSVLTVHQPPWSWMNSSWTRGCLDGSKVDEACSLLSLSHTGNRCTIQDDPPTCTVQSTPRRAERRPRCSSFDVHACSASSMAVGRHPVKY